VNESIERLHVAPVEHTDVAAAVHEGHVGDLNIDVRSGHIEDPCDAVCPDARSAYHRLGASR
jgi:hypothetical protein